MEGLETKELLASDYITYNKIYVIASKMGLKEDFKNLISSKRAKVVKTTDGYFFKAEDFFENISNDKELLDIFGDRLPIDVYDLHTNQLVQCIIAVGIHAFPEREDEYTKGNIRPYVIHGDKLYEGKFTFLEEPCTDDSIGHKVHICLSFDSSTEYLNIHKLENPEALGQFGEYFTICPSNPYFLIRKIREVGESEDQDFLQILGYMTAECNVNDPKEVEASGKSITKNIVYPGTFDFFKPFIEYKG